MGLVAIQQTRKYKEDLSIKNVRTISVSTKKSHKEIYFSTALSWEIIRRFAKPRFDIYTDDETNKVYLKISERENIRLGEKGYRLRVGYQEGAEWLRHRFNLEDNSFSLEVDINIFPTPDQYLQYEVLPPQKQ